MNMISFIVTLLVLSTVNVDAQRITDAYAIFNDGNGSTIGELEFYEVEHYDDRNMFIRFFWDFEDMPSLHENLDDLQFYLHESCTGDVYESESFNSESNVNCTNNEWRCIAETHGTNFTEQRDDESFMFNGITIPDLVGLYFAIHLNDEVVACSKIYNRIKAEVVIRKRGDMYMQMSLTGQMEDLYFYATWTSNAGYKFSQIQIRENPAIDGNCSTTGNMFNPANHDRTCAYGNITCESDQPDNDIRLSEHSSFGANFNYMNAQTLFCVGENYVERSVAFILENEAEPRFCGTFNFTNGPIDCTREPGDGDVDENDDSSAIARGSYQGYLFAVVFCLCAFYFQ